MKKTDPKTLRVKQDECSHCGGKGQDVVFLKAFNGQAAICPHCIMAAASALLDHNKREED